MRSGDICAAPPPRQLMAASPSGHYLTAERAHRSTIIRNFQRHLSIEFSAGIRSSRRLRWRAGVCSGLRQCRRRLLGASLSSISAILPGRSGGFSALAPGLDPRLSALMGLIVHVGGRFTHLHRLLTAFRRPGGAIHPLRGRTHLDRASRYGRDRRISRLTTTHDVSGRRCLLDQVWRLGPVTSRQLQRYEQQRLRCPATSRSTTVHW